MHVLHIGARVIPHILGCVLSLSLIRASAQRVRGDLLSVRVLVHLCYCRWLRVLLPAMRMQCIIHRARGMRAHLAILVRLMIPFPGRAISRFLKRVKAIHAFLAYVATCSRKSCPKVMRPCYLHGIVVSWGHIACRLSYGCHVSDPIRRVVISVGMSRFVIVARVLHTGARVMPHILGCV